MIVKTEQFTDQIKEGTIVLVVDDEPNVMAVLREMLEGENYRLLTAYSLAEARSILSRENINIVLTDLILGDGSGADILKEAARIHPDCKTIIMTGRPAIQEAIGLMKQGAYDYLAKPFGMETLKMALNKAEEKIRLERENIQLREMMSFYRISQAMGTAIELDELLKLILDSSAKEFESDVACLYFVDKTSKQLALKASTGIYDKSIKDLIFDHCLEISQYTTATGEPSIYNDPDLDYSSEELGVKSSLCQPLKAKGQITGTLIVIRIKNPHPFTHGQLTGLGLLASKAAGAIENSNLYEDLKDTYVATVEALATAIEARDSYTRGHTERVYVLSCILAEELGWDESKLGDLKIGGILHDIGKIAVPDAILNKPGPLTKEEFEIMRQHPEQGARMVESISFLRQALPYILSHHERHDGKGYPFGLEGDEIPYPGRLLAVVDTIDAITSDRPYRKGRSMAKAIDEVRRNAGTQFHPEVVEACLKAYEKGKLEYNGK